jgi:hypothetical protein
MQLVSVSKQQKQRVFFFLCAAVAAVLMLTSKQEDPGVVAADAVVQRDLAPRRAGGISAETPLHGLD